MAIVPVGSIKVVDGKIVARDTSESPRTPSRSSGGSSSSKPDSTPSYTPSKSAPSYSPGRDTGHDYSTSATGTDIEQLDFNGIKRELKELDDYAKTTQGRPTAPGFNILIGHARNYRGGNDLGAEHNGLNEVEINIALAHHVITRAKDAGYNVYIINDHEDMTSKSMPKESGPHRLSEAHQNLSKHGGKGMTIELHSNDTARYLTNSKGQYLRDSDGDKIPNPRRSVASGFSTHAKPGTEGWKLADDILKNVENTNTFPSRGISNLGVTTVARSRADEAYTLIETGFVVADYKRFNNENMEKVAAGILDGAIQYSQRHGHNLNPEVTAPGHFLAKLNSSQATPSETMMASNFQGDEALKYGPPREENAIGHNLDGLSAEDLVPGGNLSLAEARAVSAQANPVAGQPQDFGVPGSPSTMVAAAALPTFTPPKDLILPAIPDIQIAAKFSEEVVAPAVPSPPAVEAVKETVIAKAEKVTKDAPAQEKAEAIAKAAPAQSSPANSIPAMPEAAKAQARSAVAAMKPAATEFDKPAVGTNTEQLEVGKLQLADVPEFNEPKAAPTPSATEKVQEMFARFNGESGKPVYVYKTSDKLSAKQVEAATFVQRVYNEILGAEIPTEELGHVAGGKTASLTKQYQEQNSLKGDGIVGPDTYDKMESDILTLIAKNTEISDTMMAMADDIKVKALAEKINEDKGTLPGTSGAKPSELIAQASQTQDPDVARS